jgi:hypothetical protein
MKKSIWFGGAEENQISPSQDNQYPEKDFNEVSPK